MSVLDLFRSDAAPDQLDADLGDVFDLLGNERRRIVLRTVADLDCGEGIRLGDLADVVAAIETDTPRDAVGARDRKTAYVSLYQVHIGRLADAGLIATDERENVIYETDATETALAIVDDAEQRLEGER